MDRLLLRPATFGLLGILLATVVGVVSLDALDLRRSGFPGFFVYANGQLSTIGLPSWSGAVAGMPLNGGRLVDETGRAQRGASAFEQARGVPIGTEIVYRVKDGQAVREIGVPTMQLTTWDLVLTVGNYLANATVCFAIALLALALRPEHPGSRALAFVMVLLGLTLAMGVDHVSRYRFSFAYPVVEAWVPAGIIALTLNFPSPQLTRPFRRGVVISALGLATLIGVANGLLSEAAPDQARRLVNGIYVLWAVTAFGLLGNLGSQARRGATEADRLRAAVVFSGALISFLLPSVALIAFFLLGWNFSTIWLTALIFVFPLSVLYAVVRHDLFEAERIIRVSLGYGVATAGVVVAYAALVTLVEQLSAPVAGPVAGFLVLVGLAFAVDPLRRAVQRSVDRLFFRSVENPAQVLEDSGAELATLTDPKAIRDGLSERLADALHLEWAKVLPATGPAEGAGREAFREPLVFRGAPLGWLVGGRKRSGAPFSETDRELIRGLAAQGSLALRNAASIGELTRTQAALLRAQRFAVIGEFAGAVAHGMRNPLAGIRAAAQIAQEQADGSVNEPLQETLQGVLSEADRLDQRIRTLLDFSRPVEPKPRQVDLAELVERVRSSMSRTALRKGVELRDACDRPGLQVTTDPDYLEEVLLELTGNAIRATPERGEVQLELVSDEEDGTVLRVRDTGPGIPAAVQERIFDLFFTTRPDGTGLGLPSVRRIVEMLGGAVTLESSSSAGTCFAVRLPGGELSARGDGESSD